MNTFRLTLIFALLAIIQSNLLAAAGPVAQSINLVLLGLVVQAIRVDPRSLLWLAWWSGLWLDLGSFDLFGWHMGWLLGFAGCLIVMRRMGVSPQSRLQVAAATIMGSLFYDASLALALSATHKHLWPLATYFPIWLAGALLTGLVAYSIKPTPRNYLASQAGRYDQA